MSHDALIESAAVFLESFQPEVTARPGIGYSDVATLNPRIIYLSVCGSRGLVAVRRRRQAAGETYAVL